MVVWIGPVDERLDRHGDDALSTESDREENAILSFLCPVYVEAYGPPLEARRLED